MMGHPRYHAHLETSLKRAHARHGHHEFEDAYCAFMLPTVYLQGVRLVANRPRLMERLRQIGAVGGVSAGQQGSQLGRSGTPSQAGVAQ